MTKNKYLTTFIIFIADVISVLLDAFLSDWLVRKTRLVFSRRLMGMVAQGGDALGLIVTGLSSNNRVALVALTVSYLLWPPNGIVNFSTCVDTGGNYAGSVAGIMNCCGKFGGFLLSIVFGKLAQSTHSFLVPLLVVAAMLLAGCSFWLLANPEQQITTVSRVDQMILHPSV